MQINSNYNSTSFSSRNCPVKPFTIKTPKGTLSCSELDCSKVYKSGFYQKFARYFLDIFANTSSHPFWIKCRKPTLEQAVYDDYVKSTVREYKKYFKNPDTTVLLAKDKENRIVGAVYSRSLDLDKPLVDKDTLYIDGLAVSPEYRGQNVGKTLLEKVLKASKDRFSDVFLVAYKESAEFYKKLDFHRMDEYDSSQKFAIKKLADLRIDYPDYADFMHKKLGKNLSDEWYKRIEKNK